MLQASQTSWGLARCMLYFPLLPQCHGYCSGTGGAIDRLLQGHVI